MKHPYNILLDPDLKEGSGGAAEVKPAEVPESTITLSEGFNPPNDGDIRKSLSPDIDQKVINFDDFTKIVEDKDPSRIKPEIKKDIKPEVKKEEVKPTEAKKDEVKPEVKVEVKPSEVKPEPETKVEPTTEDDKQKYGEVAIGFFSKMAKEAREYLKARLDDLTVSKTKIKELETKLAQTPEGLPLSYLDHPEAFTLDPKFRQANLVKQNVSGELNYWRQQLIAVRSAQKWKDLARNEKGEIIQIEREPSAEADTQLTERIMQAMRIMETQDSEIQRIQNSFKQNYENKRQAFKQLEGEYFPNYAGDKGKDNKYIKTFMEVLDSKGEKDNILSPAFSMLYAFAMEREEYIKKLEGESKKAGEIKKAVVNAGPNSADINNVGGERKVVDINQKPFDPDEFLKAKEV